MTFHEKIGSLSEHMARAGVIAASLAEQAGLTAEETAAVARAAEIYKFDLLTGMVGEFDELQGIMGENTPFSLVKMLRLRQLSVSTTFLIQQMEPFQRLRLVLSSACR